MPLRKKLAPMRMDAQYLAERIRTNELTCLVERGMIPKLKTNQDFAARFLSRLLQNIETLQGMGNRLLEQNMTACLSSRDCHIQMHGRGIGNDHSIRFVLFE